MEPGCKFDYALLLIGEEGTGKSSIFKSLAGGGEWFGELSTLEGKAAVESLTGVWICEFSEMNIASKHSQDELKQFLSRTSDRFRPAYGKVPVEYKRMSAYCGTTNRYKALEDVDGTGNRRFWPLTVGRNRMDTYDWRSFGREVEQIWGEVVSWYRDGQSCEVDARLMPEIADMRRACTREDEWEGLIHEWLARVSDVNKMGIERVWCVGRMHIAVECLNISPDKYTKMHGNRIATIMDRHPNWKNNGTTPVYDKGYGRVKGWKLLDE
jgi:putative DNA primase/helicase